MRARLTAAIIGAIVVTLLLGGAATLLVSYRRTQVDTQRELRANVEAVSEAIAELATVDVDLPPEQQEVQARRRLALLRSVGRVFNLDGLSVLVTSPQGGLASNEPLPPPVRLSDIDPTRLSQGEIIDGSRNGVAYAITSQPLPGRPQLIVVVATRDIATGLRPALGLLMLVGVGTVLAGALLAVYLGGRLARPVRAAARAAVAVAAGELDTRLPERPGSDNEFDQLTRSINHMAASLQRARTLEQQFLLSVGHDLRTPLTSIRGYAEAISDGASDPTTAAAVIQREATKLDRLVGDLLDLARLQSTEFALRLTRVDAAAVARSSVMAAHTAAEQASVQLTIAAPGPGTAMVEADADRLGQVIDNLLTNALRYARRAVHVTVVASADRWQVIVDDDGTGIAANDLPHVFERLYRAAHTPTRHEVNSGLGLAIVKEMSEAMGGSVTAGTAPQGGARFTVSLRPVPS